MRTRSGKEALKRRQTMALENLKQHLKSGHAEGKTDNPHVVGRKGSLETHKKEISLLQGKLNVAEV